MQVQIFSIPVWGGTLATEELNRFLRPHRILSLEKRLVEQEGESCWTFCIQYLERTFGTESDAVRPGAPKVDYKEVLSASDFAVFARLRDARKRIAKKEAVPPYAIFTNEQLAEMITTKVSSLAAMEKIDGVGTARLKKYGAAMLDVLVGAAGGGGVATLLPVVATEEVGT